MASDVWFPDPLRHLLDSKQQAAQRDKTGELREGYLQALDDMRLALGLNERPRMAAWQVVEARQIDG